MKSESIGRAIGAASLAFGIADLMFGRRLGRAIGAGEEMGGRLFRIAGAREVATGLAGLAAPGSALPVQWRLAGDLFDLAMVGWHCRCTSQSGPQEGVSRLEPHCLRRSNT